jgi:hypothetical protein
MSNEKRAERVAGQSWSLTLSILSVTVVLLAGCAAESPKTAAGGLAPAHTTSQTSTVPADDFSEKLKAAAAKPSATFEEAGWRSLFDGSSLLGWHVTQFAGRAEVECQSGLLVFNMGDPFTGIDWTNDFPKMNFEVALDAMRIMGSDFFCGLTVPVGDSFCSLIVGGWGGSLVGISSLDGQDASENETTKFENFQSDRWYRIRLRITEKRIEAWLDKQKLVDVVTTDKRISLRPGDIELSKPFGLASYQTTAAFREIRVHSVDGPADAKIPR